MRCGTLALVVGAKLAVLQDALVYSLYDIMNGKNVSVTTKTEAQENGRYVHSLNFTQKRREAERIDNANVTLLKRIVEQ